MTEILHWARQHKASAAALVLVVAGCLALLLLARRVHHLRPKTAVVSAMPAPATGAAATSGAQGLTPTIRAGTGQTSRSARMRGEFEHAPRYLAFIQDAMSRPQEGGKFYSLLAWRRCNQLLAHPGVAPTHTGSDALHDGALASIEGVEKRCSGVHDAYPAVQALYQVVMEQRGGRDFLMPANGRGIVAPARRETANGDIDAAIGTGDRWAQAEALEANADWLDADNSNADGNLDRRLKEWGAETVACELVGNCRGGIQAALHCVATGECAHDDYRDVVRAEVPETHQIIFDTLVEVLHRRMGLAPGKPSPDADAR